MRFSAYARMAAWEYVLLALMSTGLAYVLLQAFYAGDAFAASPVPAMACVLIDVVLFLLASSRRIMRAGGVAFGIACVVGLAACAAASSVSPASDEPGNYFIVALVVLASTLVPFFLSRRESEAIVLLVACVFACSWIQFYYQADMVVWSLVVLCCALALPVYKNYQRCARTAATAKRVSFGLGAGVSAAAVAAAVGLGALAWFAIIAPLDPSTLKVELITEVRAYETLEVRGTSEEYQTPNTDMTSSRLTEQSRTVDDLQIGEDGIPMPARTKTDASTSEESEGTYLGIDSDSLRDAFDFESNPTGAVWRVALAVFLPLLIIVAYFVGRRLWRKRRLRQIQKLPGREQAAQLYAFVLDRLARIGYALPPGMTLSEYAVHNASSLGEYDRLAGADFGAATSAYIDTVYGAHEPTAEELSLVGRYYTAFWKFARKKLGNLKYFFKSFKL